MKHFLFFVIFFTAPALAQSFYPNLAGQRYCQLRQLGMERGLALRTSIEENLAKDRVSPRVFVNGRSMTMDQLEMVHLVLRCDRQ